MKGLAQFKWILLVVTIASLTGCLVAPIFYPSCSYVPAVEMTAVDEKTFALIVNVRGGPQSNFKFPYSWREDCSLYQVLEVSPGQGVPAQVSMHLNAIVVGMFPIPIPLLEVDHATREVWLYRPGFELMVAPAWSSPRFPKWRQHDAFEQQVAGFEKMTRMDSQKCSLADRKRYLDLIAREANRLAKLVPNDSESQAKYGWLAGRATEWAGLREQLEKQNEVPKN
jgi:hypothetical protein